MRLMPVLTLEDARAIAAAAKHSLSEKGRAGTIAIVDRGGALLYLERPEDQVSNSVDMAIGKARAAVFRGRPSAALEERVRERPGFLMSPNQIGVRGGVPVFYREDCLAGVGVSGVDKFDESAALAGVAHFEASWREPLSEKPTR